MAQFRAFWSWTAAGQEPGAPLTIEKGQSALVSMLSIAEPDPAAVRAGRGCRDHNLVAVLEPAAAAAVRESQRLPPRPCQLDQRPVLIRLRSADRP